MVGRIELYGVKTRVLVQAVKRNANRFPPHVETYDLCGTCRGVGYIRM